MNPMYALLPRRASRLGLAALVAVLLGGAAGCGGSGDDGGSGADIGSTADTGASDASTDVAADATEDATADGGNDTGDDAPDDVSADTADTSDAGGDPAPPIDEALTCRTADPPSRSVRPGDDLMRVTLDAPDAVCNDGTPGVFYVRPGSGANADRWVVWFEGGGGCTSAATCAERWCGNNVPTAPSKMSSRWAPNGIVGTGLFADTLADGAPNAFADWTHVVLYYCSSDAWAGRVDQDRVVDETGMWPDYAIRFRGQAILDAALERLREGAESDDASVRLPSLGAATTLVISGTSAGGAGARLNIDRIAAPLVAANPDLDLRLVVDAGVVPREPGPEVTAEEVAAFHERSAAIATGFRGSDTDASCLEAHADDPSPCYDSTHVLLHHVDQRTFVKMDVSDPVDAPSVYADLAAFERATRAALDHVAEGRFVPEEAGLALPEVVFAPDCQHHVALESASFSTIGVEADGVTRSFHDALIAWLDDAPLPNLVDGGTGGATSVCDLSAPAGWPTEPGRHNVNLAVDGVARSAHLVLPSGFDPATPTTLVVMLHGASGQARPFADDLDELRRLADDRGVVLLFPQGLDNIAGTSSWAWSDDPITGEWDGTPPDDVRAIAAFIDTARRDLGVDGDLVFVAGFSKGGRMAQHFAAAQPDRVRGLIVGSSSIGSTFMGGTDLFFTAEPSAPVPALLAHGTADPLLPYAGSADVTSFDDEVALWRDANGCDPVPATTTSGAASLDRYEGCDAPLQAITVGGLTHRWAEDGDATGFSMSAAAFTFIDRF